MKAKNHALAGSAPSQVILRRLLIYPRIPELTFAAMLLLLPLISCRRFLPIHPYISKLIIFAAMLSALIITFNEERNIERCLLSVKEICDELIVVDSGSTDHTVAIAERLGARVIHQPFLGYIEQKNFAISQAAGDWLLSLDADEAPDDSLRNSIAEAMKNPAADAYSMNRLTNYCGEWVRHSGWYPDIKIRLFKKEAGKWTGINPHDRYEVYSGKTPLHLKGDLLHYSYNSISDHLKQIDRFSSIGAKALYDKGEKSSIAKLLYKPVARFLRAYIVWSGYRDGLTGFIIAVNSAHAVFLKYLRLYYLQKGKSL